MRVAIPLFGEEVSPRFGCATQFLVATIQGDSAPEEEVKDVSRLAPWQFAEFLASVGVAKVICGGVHRRFQEELEHRGIEVVWGVIGPAALALAAFLDGTLRRDQFVCRGRHGWRGRGWGGGRGPGPPRFPGEAGRRRGQGLAGGPHT